MKRYLSILMVLFGFVFSSFASASEWEVKGGDTLWKILAEACQVVPSLQKARVFARAVGIQTPSLIVIGERIDVSRGCAALSDAIAISLEKAVVLSNQQGETLRALQIKLASLEMEATQLRRNLESAERRDVAHEGKTQSSRAQVGVVPVLASYMEGLAPQGTGAKGYHAYGDPVFFFKGWMVLAAGLCLFAGFSFLRKRRRDGRMVYRDRIGGEALALPMAPSNMVSLRSTRIIPAGSLALDFSEQQTVDIPL